MNAIAVLDDLPTASPQSTSSRRTVVAGINRNTELLRQNATSILANSQGVALNSANIVANRGLIGINTAAIELNTQAISSIREGNASIAAIPDLYLQGNETWTIAGGVSAYDDGFGGVETGFGGGIQLRSKPSDNWSLGFATAITPNTQVVRVQARIGG